MNFLKKIFKRFFPDHVYYQVYVVYSDPYSETVTPFEFRIDQINNEEELSRLALSSRDKCYGAKQFWSSVQIERIFTTVRSQKGVIPSPPSDYMMGSHQCTRRFERTISVTVND